MFTFKRNGEILAGGILVGIWWYQNIWEEQGGRRDASGNLTVKGLWHYADITGQHNWGYKKADLTGYLLRDWEKLMKAHRELTEEQKWININNA